MTWRKLIENIAWENYQTNIAPSQEGFDVLPRHLVTLGTTTDESMLQEAFDAIVFRIEYGPLTFAHAVLPTLKVLIAMLADESCPNRHKVIQLLYTFRPPWTPTIDVLPKDHPRKRFQQTTKIMQTSYRVIMRLQEDKDSSLFEHAIVLLVSRDFFWKVEYAVETLKYLRTSIQQETEKSVEYIEHMAYMLNNYRDFLESSFWSKMVDFLRPYLESDNIAIRWQTECAFAVIYRENTPEPIIQKLTEHLLELDSVLDNDVYFDPRLPEHQKVLHTSGVALRHVSSDTTIDVYHQLLKQTASIKRARQYAISLLDFALEQSTPFFWYPRKNYQIENIVEQPDGGKYITYTLGMRWIRDNWHNDIRDITSLSTIERQALQIVLDVADKVWAVDNNILQRYGIEASVDELRAVLDESNL